MENDQEGEQMQIAVNAGLPETPSFPNRPLFAAAGTAVGLAFGLLIAVVLEFSDKSIRTEKDAAAVMELPLLISLPWVGGGEENEVETRRFWGRSDPGSQREHEHVGV
jgi:capsular polysaccharide biosynthesis protein